MSGQISELGLLAQLKAHAAVAFIGVTTGASVSAGAIAPRDAVALIDVSAVGGDADETMGVVIQGRNKTTDAWASVHRSDEPASMAFTQPTGAQIARIGVLPRKNYRYQATQAGTTPSFTFGAHIYTRARKQPTTKQPAA